MRFRRIKDALDTIAAYLTVPAVLGVFLYGAFQDDPDRFFGMLLSIPIVTIMVIGIAIIPFLIFAILFEKR